MAEVSGWNTVAQCFISRSRAVWRGPLVSALSLPERGFRLCHLPLLLSALLISLALVPPATNCGTGRAPTLLPRRTTASPSIRARYLNRLTRDAAIVDNAGEREGVRGGENVCCGTRFRISAPGSRTRGFFVRQPRTNLGECWRVRRVRLRQSTTYLPIAPAANSCKRLIRRCLRDGARKNLIISAIGSP